MYFNGLSPARVEQRCQGEGATESRARKANGGSKARPPSSSATNAASVGAAVGNFRLFGGVTVGTVNMRLQP